MRGKWRSLELNPYHPVISENCIKIKINSFVYFHTSLWCLKSFMKMKIQVNFSFVQDWDEKG